MEIRNTDPQQRPKAPSGDSGGARIVMDPRGVEWEVYDESQWDYRLALDWDYLPQTTNPGLIFTSKIDRRRVWPAPTNWQRLTDDELLGLCATARSVF
jgi:hypothetical protein